MVAGEGAEVGPVERFALRGVRPIVETSQLMDAQLMRQAAEKEGAGDGSGRHRIGKDRGRRVEDPPGEDHDAIAGVVAGEVLVVISEDEGERVIGEAGQVKLRIDSVLPGQRLGQQRHDLRIRVKLLEPGIHEGADLECGI